MFLMTGHRHSWYVWMDKTWFVQVNKKRLIESDRGWQSWASEQIECIEDDKIQIQQTDTLCNNRVLVLVSVCWLIGHCCEEMQEMSLATTVH